MLRWLLDEITGQRTLQYSYIGLKNINGQMIGWTYWKDIPVVTTDDHDFKERELLRECSRIITGPLFEKKVEPKPEPTMGEFE